MLADVVTGQPIALTVFLAAFFTIFVGMLLMMAASVFQGKGAGGLVFFIGPFPIAVGVGQQSSLMLIVAFALAIVSIVLFFLFTRKLTRVPI